MAKKKLLILNWHTTGGLDFTSSDVLHWYDKVANLDGFPGYEYYIHNPYVRQKKKFGVTRTEFGITEVDNDWVANCDINQFDIILSSIPQMLAVMIAKGGRIGLCRSSIVAIEAVERYNGTVYNYSADFRVSQYKGTITRNFLDNFQPQIPQFEKYYKLLYKFFDEGKLVNSSPSGFDQDGNACEKFNYPENYWYYAPVMRFNWDAKWDFIYAGLSQPNGIRKAALLEANKVAKVATLGGIKVKTGRKKQLPSVSNYQNVSDPQFLYYLKRQAKFELSVADPWLNWGSHRFIDSFSAGCVALCHHSYEYGSFFMKSIGLGNRVIYNEKDLARFIELGQSDLFYLYQEQLNKTAYLRKRSVELHPKYEP